MIRGDALDPSAVARTVAGADGPESLAASFSLGPWSAVRVGDVAAHLLTLAQNESSVHQAPMLHTPRSRHPAPEPTPQPIHG